MSTYGTYINGEDPNKKDPNAVGATTPTTPTVLPYEGFIGTGTASNAYNTSTGYYEGIYGNTMGALNANRDLGYTYAQGVKDSLYASAEALRQQTDANTEVARQRGIIDSKSSYQKAVGAYGANAEALGTSGLGASGYGEYLNANAYATHRGQVQDINANALKANRESAYLEAQSKQAADSEYLKNIYNIDTAHNTGAAEAENAKTTGIYQAGLELGNASNSAYDSLFNSAATGTSIDVIKQSGVWGDLTPEQQVAVENAANKYTTDTNYNTAIDLINKGWTIDEIKNYFGGEDSDAWKALASSGQAEKIENAATKSANDKAEADADANYKTALGLLADGWMVDEIKAHLGEEAVKTLTDSGKLAQIENAASVMSRIKSETEGKTASEKLLTYVELALDGMDIDTIQKIAESLGHYDVLSAKNPDGTSLWDAVTEEAEKTAADAEKTEKLTAIDTMIQNGDSTEEIKASEEYKSLDETDRAKVDETLETRDENVDNYVNYLLGEIITLPEDKAIKSKDALDLYLNTYIDAKDHLLSTDIKDKITAKWQATNAEYIIEDISQASVTKSGLVSNGEEYTGIEIANDIKNGVYGDNAQAVVDAYCEFIYNNLDKFLNLPGGASYAYSQASNIGPLASEWAKKINTAINQKTGYTSPTTSSTKSDGSVYSAAGISRPPDPFPGGK